VAGVYVVYSKISFGCGGRHDLDGGTLTHSYLHKIIAMDGKGGKSVHISVADTGEQNDDLVL